jgi:multiple sugar transport system substrate-binding protein
MAYSNILNYNQLSLPVVDAKTETAQMNNDGWKRMFDNFKRFYEIPGNELTSKTPPERDAFTKDRNLAMRAGNIYINAMREIDESANPMKWDMVTLPTFKEAPNTGISFIGHFLAISATSKYKQQAFAVIQEMVSDGFQLMRSEETTEGLVLKNAEIKKAAGKNISSFSKINLQAVTKLKIAKSPRVTEYDNKAYGVVTKKFKEYVQGGKDVNTVLRETNEEINKMIATEKTK